MSVVGDRAARGRFESPDLQRDAIDAWAGAHGVRIVDEVRDLNRSGGTLTRPGLERAMEMLRDGVAEGIVVARSDRASRRTLDGLGLIDSLEREGFWIAAADGTIDTTSRIARMATTMHLAMAQSELERYREQSAVIHERAIVEKGRHMGPAGFGFDRGDDGRLLVDEERARWARRIFEWRADGVGWVTIARNLEEAGVRQRSGRFLTPLMLRRMVKRRAYVGEAVHGDHVRPNAHPAIVDEALWAAANRVEPVVRSDAAPQRAHADSLLRGLLRCAGCRYALKRLPQRDAPPRWACRTVVGERGATHDCADPARVKGSRHQSLEDEVVSAFFDFASGVAAERRDVEADIADMLRHAEDAEALLDELASVEVRRRLGAARWSQMTAQARAEADHWRQAVATAKAATRGIADRATLEDAWPGMTLDERQDALRAIVQAVMVGSGGEIVAIVPVWVDADLPRIGGHDFVARPWGSD